MKKKFFSVMLAACLLITLLATNTIAYAQDTSIYNVDAKAECKTVTVTNTFPGSVNASNANCTLRYDNPKLNLEKTMLPSVAMKNQSKDFNCEFYSNGTCAIIEYLGSSNDVVIPSEIDGYTVTTIGTGILVPDLKTPEHVTSISIPSTVTGIWFSGTGLSGLAGSALESITVATDNQVFSSDKGILFSKNKDTIEVYPCGKNEESYSIPNGVKNITMFAFQENKYLKRITIPDGTEYIGPWAFLNCSKLERIDIPNSVTDIQEEAFIGSNKLTIYCNKGSIAEKYALENNIKFVAKPNLPTIGTPDLSDETYNIYLFGKDNDTIPGNTELKVTETETTVTKITYDIVLINSGKEIQPNGEVTINISVPNNMDSSKCKVYRQETDGKYTDMNAVYQDGYMVFTTDHFSVYVLTTRNMNVEIGDVNGDGTIDAADAVLVQRYDSGIQELAADQLIVADVTGDGMVDAADTVKIQRYDAGIITEI